MTKLGFPFNVSSLEPRLPVSLLSSGADFAALICSQDAPLFNLSTGPAVESPTTCRLEMKNPMLRGRHLLGGLAAMRGVEHGVTRYEPCPEGWGLFPMFHWLAISSPFILPNEKGAVK